MADCGTRGTGRGHRGTGRGHRGHRGGYRGTGRGHRGTRGYNNSNRGNLSGVRSIRSFTDKYTPTFTQEIMNFLDSEGYKRSPAGDPTVLKIGSFGEIGGRCDGKSMTTEQLKELTQLCFISPSIIKGYDIYTIFITHKYMKIRYEKRSYQESHGQTIIFEINYNCPDEFVETYNIIHDEIKKHVG